MIVDPKSYSTIKQYLDRSKEQIEYDEYDIKFVEQLCRDEEISVYEAVDRWEVIAKEYKGKELKISMTDCKYED